MKLIHIEVAYATPQKQIILPLRVQNDTTIFDAIKLSNICNEFSELANYTIASTLKVGIFGKKVDIATYKLQAHDRIEIYRPLAKTPNQRRLERAKL